LFDDTHYRKVNENLQKLKYKLNMCKRQIDIITTSEINTKRYNFIRDMLNSYDYLRGRHGIIAKKYSGEIVTNAWLKMYELTRYLPLKRSSESTTPNNKYTTISLAEAPGNFLLAINHFIKTHRPDTEWTWYANTYLPSKTSSGSSEYLDDDYGLIGKYPHLWLYGEDGTGDITSSANLRHISNSIPQKVDLVTSDVKYVPININYDEEEKINIPVHMGHTLGSLILLEKGGTAILKELSFFEMSSVCLLLLLCSTFDSVKIVKPLTSRPTNSEVYVVCTGYKKNLTMEQVDRLCDVLDHIRSLTPAKQNFELEVEGVPSLFLYEDVPEEFLTNIINIMTEMVSTQCKAIEDSIKFWKKYKTKSFQDIKKMYHSSNTSNSLDWIKDNDIRILKTSDSLLSQSKPTTHNLY